MEHAPARGRYDRNLGRYPHVRSLLIIIQIFQPTDVETEKMALSTTQVLVRTIYQGRVDEAPQAVEIEGLAKDVCEECIKILKEPEKNQANHAIKVICAFVSTTRKCVQCSTVVMLTL